MRHSRAGRLALVVVTAVSVGVLAAACSSSSGGSRSGGSGGGAGTGGAGTTSIVVGSLPVTDTAGLQVALKEGFFKQAGLNVTVKSVTQSTAAIPDLLHGSIDVIGGGNYVSFLEADANGTFPVEFLAPAVDCTADTYGVVAMPSAGISKPAGLAGKTIAVNLTQNIQTLTTSAVLAAAGVSASSLHYVQIPFPDMVSALQAGRVNAISAVEPFLSAALAAGGKLVTSTCSGPMANFPLSGYVTTRTWTQQHATAARAFQQALEKGNAYANTHPNVVRALLPTYTKITAKAAASMPLGTYPAALTTAPVQRIAALMHSGGLAAPSDVSALLFR
ncbi:MAG TPA: ABC transporter substrate-binding protein [Trebonia sp.]|jgi:NitT/TauT family transport system substrate-binding protein|nr:ABC transporter substrate-binding protein [Trebonia sp.]